MERSNDNIESGHMPDAYDRAMGTMAGLPGVQITAPSVRQEMTPLVGDVETYIVRTLREQHETDEGAVSPPKFTLFLEVASKRLGHIRLVIPHRVCETIARQRESLTNKARSKAAKAAAATRKARGIVPGFLKPGTKRGRRKRVRRDDDDD